MKISTLIYQTKFADSDHPVLAIDDISLDVWLNYKLNQPNILDLVPA
jgi:hypothetical protein